MRRICFFIILLGLTTFCFSQSRSYVSPGVQKIFLRLNLLYDYEKFSLKDSYFYITSNNVLFEFDLGYDFGIIVPRVYLDLGLPIDGEVGFADGKMKLTDVMDTSNIKFGLEAGIKPVKTENFELIIPIGVLHCSTIYTQKNPAYTPLPDSVPYDRIWDFSYFSIYSGIDASIKLNNHLKLRFSSRIGIPVKRELEYKDVLRGNYVWSSTGTATNSVKFETNVTAFSIGIGISANL